MPEVDNELIEMEVLIDFQKDYAWRVFRNLLNRRRLHCDEEMKNCLRKNDNVGALEWLAKSDEIVYISDKLVVNRKNELSRMIKEK